MQMENIQGRELTVKVCLTDRERQVADLVADGLTNAEIAGRLNIASQTVSTHIDRIRCKTATIGVNRVKLALTLRG